MSYCDIDLQQGIPFSLAVNASGVSNAPINLSGFNARGGIIYSFSDSGIYENFGVTMNEPLASGSLTISLTSAQTSGLAPTQAMYQVEIFTSGNANVIKLLQGKVNIYPDMFAQ